MWQLFNLIKERVFKVKFKAIAFAVATLAVGVNTASAVDGTINFTGTVSATACTVNSIAGTGSTTGSVDFGQVSSTTLTSAGVTTVGTPFSIELTDCADSVSNPLITFNGEQVNSSEYSDLFESGAAEGAGVGIRITDASSGTPYTPGDGAPNSGFGTITSGSATGNFNAYLVAYESGSKSGDVDASVTFTIAYQ
ncbi:fimbrial protein [Klebsiella oxytoca]|uniref:fimbrial protein n=1 Tax=Klebsiella oxytoca TaxID=571 RepID=UPI0006696E2F|nr:fimbrial protein [Klebsiella oxytoca]